MKDRDAMDYEARRRAGVQLENRMNALQLTREILCTQLGVSDMTISRMFRGTTGAPSLETAVRLGAALGFTPNEIAQLYGYWTPRTEMPDRRIDYIHEIADNLPQGDRERLLNTLEAIAQNAFIEANKRRK